MKCILALALLVSAASAYNCVHRDSAGNLYDLSPLRHATYYSVVSGAEIFMLNLCGAVSGPFLPKECRNSSICMEVDRFQLNTTFLSVGSALDRDVTFIFHPNEMNGISVSVAFAGGSFNDATGKNRNSMISFVCGTGLGDDANAITYMSHNANTWYFQWRTRLVCNSATTTGDDDSSSDGLSSLEAYGGLVLGMMALLVLVVCLFIALVLCCCRMRVHNRYYARLAANNKAPVVVPIAPQMVPAAGEGPQQWFWQWNGTGYQAVPVPTGAFPYPPAVSSLNAEFQPQQGTTYNTFAPKN